ncbi:MAG: hypothetical protein ACXABY_17355, partial [Candidatus Thorarchaeota archaeon]
EQDFFRLLRSAEIEHDPISQGSGEGQAEDAIIRLANTKMPEDPCGCETAQRLWREDRQRPDPTTVPRLNNPFGMSNGAWAAWKYAQAMKVFRAGVL